MWDKCEFLILTTQHKGGVAKKVQKHGHNMFLWRNKEIHCHIKSHLHLELGRLAYNYKS